MRLSAMAVTAGGHASTVCGNAEAAARSASFETVLAHMSQGVCMFDAEQRLVVCNHRYLEIYGIAEGLLQPGVTLREVLERRINAGNVPMMSAEDYIADRMKAVRDAVPHSAIHRLRDGRMIAVGHQPMADGGWLTTHDDVTQIYTLQQEIAHLAYHDQLTELPNRRKLNEALDEALVCSGRRFALMLMDLDGFKTINDSLGHSAGDRLLQAVGRRLRRCIRDGDLVARIGGDEFAILCAEGESRREVSRLAQRVVRDIAAPFVIDGLPQHVRASIGIAVAQCARTDRDELLRHADMAMYEAKRTGGHGYRYHDELSLRSARAEERVARPA